MTAGEREADLIYAPVRFEMLRPGHFVVCAITGEQIPLEQLRYWSVTRQEPYATPQASLDAVAKRIAAACRPKQV